MKRLTLLMLVLAVGCSVEPCDPGQTQDQLGFCAPPAPSAGGTDAGAPPDASGGTGEEGGAGGAAAAPVCEEPSSFGDECRASADCHCDIDYCAIMPNESSGVCTKTGCVEDPSICPDDWMCIDLSAFMPDLPSICVPQG